MQGFNMGRYVPPEHEGLTSGNRLHGKRGMPATVRFEMPFPIWCTTCKPEMIIGQGVRFNATKRIVGAYHSTPIFAFRMRHPACGGEIEICTDPQNTTYIVKEGGRRRDTGEGKDDDSLLRSAGEPFTIPTLEEREAARTSAFAKLEKTISDREMIAEGSRRLEGLLEVQGRDWKDPYARNQRLRRDFRVRRKERERDAEVGERLREKMSLGIEILPSREEDAREAAFVEFGGETGLEVGKVLRQPLFDERFAMELERFNRETIFRGSSRPSAGRLLKSEIAATNIRKNLAMEIVSNTKAAKDPFLDFGALQERFSRSPVPRIPGLLKRKRRPEVEGEGKDAPAPSPPPPTVALSEKMVSTPGESTSLVAYNSDSD